MLSVVSKKNGYPWFKSTDQGMHKSNNKQAGQQQNYKYGTFNLDRLFLVWPMQQCGCRIHRANILPGTRLWTNDWRLDIIECNHHKRNRIWKESVQVDHVYGMSSRPTRSHTIKKTYLQVKITVPTVLLALWEWQPSVNPRGRRLPRKKAQIST